MRPIPLANHLSASEFQERIHQEKDASIRDKYRALLWILQGERRGETGERLGVGRNTICQWVNRYNSEGESGLRRKPGQGRKRVITSDKVKRIKKWVSEREGVWTLKRVSLKLGEEEGLSVSQQAIWYRLKESRWSWKTGRPRNPKADEKAQEAFKKTA